MKPLTLLPDNKNESRMPVLYFCLFILAFVICNMFFWTPDNALFNQEPYFKMDFMSNIAYKKPEIIMLGNSMLQTRVDDKYFSKLAKVNSIKITSGGAASAFWYLAFKNIIIPSLKQQATVVVFFRDHYLTDPGYRVKGNYKTRINALAEEDEPLLYDLAYEGKMNFPGRLFDRYLPLYKNREKCKLLLDDLVKNGLLLWAAAWEKGYADRMLNRVFADKNMNTVLLTKRQIEAETPDSMAVYDFDFNLQKSFLPHMISLAKTNDINLIFVRVKRRRDLALGRQPEALRKYMKNLEGYFKKNKIIYIDFTGESRIKEEHYANGDHLKSPEGSRLFTRLLAEVLVKSLDLEGISD
jgi:hypothetical protein